MNNLIIHFEEAGTCIPIKSVIVHGSILLNKGDTVNVVGSDYVVVNSKHIFGEDGYINHTVYLRKQTNGTK
jgi:hypothetical protein